MAQIFFYIIDKTMKSGHRQWKFWGCLPGKVVRDQRDGRDQEGSAGQEVQESRASNNAET